MLGFFDIYREPLFFWFPVVTTLVSMGSFLLFAVPLTWLAWREPAWAEKYRIQKRRMKAERIVGPSVRFWLRNNAILAVLTVALWPLLRLSGVHTGPLPPVWLIALQVLGFLYVDDVLYYWMHRTMHRGWLYKKVHSVHHRVPTPWAISAHYMHPVEFCLTGILMLLGPVVLGVHVVTIYIWVVVRQWEAAEGHSGYELPFSPSHLVPGYGGAEYHDFHHSRFHGNYSGFLGYLDGLFGRYAEGYRERVAHRKKTGRQRP